MPEHNNNGICRVDGIGIGIGIFSGPCWISCVLASVCTIQHQCQRHTFVYYQSIELVRVLPYAGLCAPLIQRPAFVLMLRCKCLYSMYTHGFSVCLSLCTRSAPLVIPPFLAGVFQSLLFPFDLYFTLVYLFVLSLGPCYFISSCKYILSRPRKKRINFLFPTTKM